MDYIKHRINERNKGRVVTNIHNGVAIRNTKYIFECRRLFIEHANHILGPKFTFPLGDLCSGVNVSKKLTVWMFY